jgi:mono/diheme cytochrome c family protein
LKSRIIISPTFFIYFLCITLVGCVQEMGKSGRMQPHEGTLALMKISGAPVMGTVAQNSKLMGLNDSASRSKETVLRGKILYEVNCMPCHGMSGYGDGMVVQRGFLAPPSYHIEKLRKASDQHFFDVITNGYGAMYSYSYRVTFSERWAIVSYIRALQLSQNIQFSRLSEGEKNKVINGEKPL